MEKQTADRLISKSGGWLNLYIIAAALSMAMLGLVMLFSAGAVKGAQSLLVKQLIWFAISIAAFLYAMFMDLNWLRNRSWLVYSFCILALVMVLVPGLGVKVNGAQRWLGLGPLRVQPSEFAKLGIVLMLATYFASNQRDKATLLKGFLLPSVIIGIFCVLIILFDSTIL